MASVGKFPRRQLVVKFTVCVRSVCATGAVGWRVSLVGSGPGFSVLMSADSWENTRSVDISEYFKRLSCLKMCLV